MRVLLLASTILFATISMAGVAMHGHAAITDAPTAASLGWVSRTLNPYDRYIVTPWPGNR